jgi:hypothetical protein
MNPKRKNRRIMPTTRLNKKRKNIFQMQHNIILRYTIRSYIFYYFI